MAKADSIISFEKVSFEYGHNKPILDEVDFSIRRGTKSTFMGQNGAGKSTIFELITKSLEQESGKINIASGLTTALARQVIPRDELELTVSEFFQKRFTKKVYDIDPKIDAVLEIVHLEAGHDRIINSFSGGQQARLLLASALIQDPDLLLLDEPTNNLDKEGIAHLTKFLVNYQKTVIVISHDANFLNTFTDAVLYLDVHTRKVEQYSGNYFDVVKEISVRIERENRKNAQLAKQIQENKEKANFFANKGGGMRMVAKRMRAKAEEMEGAKVDVRKEDKTIRPFTIPAQEGLVGEMVRISSFTVMRKGSKPAKRKTDISLRKGQHLLLRGPNGIGKSTLLEAIAKNSAEGLVIAEGVRIGYYRQDFSTLNFDDTVYESLMNAIGSHTGTGDEEHMRGVAAGFLITADAIRTKIGSLSEGQKGLVAFARLVLERPGLLILDEPTNHINFRHIPLIAEALDSYEGAMILVSHVPEFVAKIRIDEVLDLEK
ncbi:MAG: ABC-F family ATP-binding cassette domain-containing protein [Candidatus Spechtbacteria bacterium]|nr:ABC-F family ATP-binding cassette domain-containing protein [Candidatus Spechtbacteria bacterium]